MFRFYVRFSKERQASSKSSADRNRRFPINLSIKKLIFWSICGHPDFCARIFNFMQPTRTRRFPIKLSIEKRMFWSMCGRPGFCTHIFAKLGSRPELVDFLLNCLLRNAFFGRSAVVRTFAITFLQFWATDSNSSVSNQTVY